MRILLLRSLPLLRTDKLPRWLFNSPPPSSCIYPVTWDLTSASPALLLFGSSETFQQGCCLDYNINITPSGCNTVNTKSVILSIKEFLTMKIGYKLYFMTGKLRKMQLIYPFVLFFVFVFSYHPILVFATQTSVFYWCKIILLCGTA